MSGAAWTLPDTGSAVVQAVFEPGGKTYHYICPDAVRLGDTIKAPGNSIARVIDFGWAPGVQPYPVRTARACHKESTHAMNPTRTADDHFAEAKRLRAAEKSARKAAKLKRQQNAERARLNKLALDALADIAADTIADDGARIDAAGRLLAVTM